MKQLYEDSKPLSISVFLVEGEPDGMITASIPFQWTGHILVVNKNQMGSALEREEAALSGLYLFVGRSTKRNMLYIGRSYNELSNEIKEHDKDWWSTAILITDKERPLNKGQVDYLHKQLIKRAVEANKIYLDHNKENFALDELPEISEASTVNMEYFLNKIILVLSVLHFKYFS